MYKKNESHTSNESTINLTTRRNPGPPLEISNNSSKTLHHFLNGGYLKDIIFCSSVLTFILPHLNMFYLARGRRQVRKYIPFSAVRFLKLLLSLKKRIAKTSIFFYYYYVHSHISMFLFIKKLRCYGVKLVVLSIQDRRSWVEMWYVSLRPCLGASWICSDWQLCMHFSLTARNIFLTKNMTPAILSHLNSSLLLVKEIYKIQA